MADLVRFQAAADAVAQTVRALPRTTRWLVDCDTDADGLCGAAVAFLALRKLGHRVTLRPSRDKTTAHYRGLAASDVEGFLFIDKGSSHLAEIGKLTVGGRLAVVLDHHLVAASGPPAGVHLLNPRACGLDGSRDAAGATTAAAFALALCGDEAWAWTPHALAGAMGDWQHTPAWQGWNLHLLQQVRERRFLRTDMAPMLPAITLAEAVAARMRTSPRDAAETLRSSGFNPDAQVEELDRDAQARLVSLLALRKLADGKPGDVETLVAPHDHHVGLGLGLRQVFRIVDACGREGRPATGIAFLLGDEASRAEAMECFARYRAAIAGGLAVLREKGTEVRKAVQVAWTAAPDYTGMVAGLGIVHAVADRSRPLAILAKRPDGLVQISTRGSHGQVERGMDLGAACQAAAFAVAREGGGHPVAAGAVIPEPDVEKFLAALDSALSKQGFLKPT